MAGSDAVQLKGDSGELGSSRAPHVAIVGGGIAGVAACKALVCRGISCVLFEGKERLGGLWVNNYPGAAAQVRAWAQDPGGTGGQAPDGTVTCATTPAAFSLYPLGSVCSPG